MQGPWRATGCGIPRYRRHSTLGSLSVHGVHTHIEPIAQIAKVLLQCSLSGFTGLEAIRFPRRLAHGPPAFETIAMVRHDLKHIDYCHIVSLCSAARTRLHRLSSHGSGPTLYELRHGTTHPARLAEQ